MIFYHINRSNSSFLQNSVDYCAKSEVPFGSIFTELSSHGWNFFVGKDKNDYNCLLEIILEYVRAVKYPAMPSRFKSFFATSSPKDCLYWISCCHNKNDPFSLLTVESENYIELDCSWFTANSNTTRTIPNNINPCSVAAVSEMANNYWQGKKTNTPLNEILLPLPVKILKIEKFNNIDEFIKAYPI